MSSQLDPSAQYIWSSVATEVSSAGRRQRAPETDKDWEELGKRVTTLIDATNEIGAPNRPVAKPGDNPRRPEFLSPEEIEKLISADRTDWIALTRGLYEVSQRIQKAVGTKDTQALLAAGAQMNTACENCHTKYWYPIARR
jgi:integrase